MDLLTAGEGTTLSAIGEDISENIAQLADLPENAKEANVYFSKLLTMLEEFAVTYGGKLIIALLLFIIGFKLVNKASDRIMKSRAMKRIEATTRGFIGNILKVTFKVVIGVTALAVLGVPMSSIIAVVGSCGLAIGLALQGSLANIAGGFIILILKPFSTGDFIAMGDVSGTVQDIGIFHTKVLTIDNRVVVVPNSTISNATLVNVTAQKERRVDLEFSAGYNDDIALVENTLLKVCEKHELVLKDPAPFARLSSHGDSALIYTLRAWCKTEDYWTVYFDLIRDVKVAFDQNGISIPYPQIDVHPKQK